MIINKVLIALIATCLYSPCIAFAQYKSTINTAKSVAFTDVKAAIDTIVPGGTVVVPAGSAKWTNQLVITKGIALIGSGADKTIIQSDYNATSPQTVGADGNFLIVYRPQKPNQNKLFRLSGFTFNMANKCYGIGLLNSTFFVLDSIPHRIRIDNNFIINANRIGDSLSGIHLKAIVIQDLFGVIDNNTITNTYGIEFTGNENNSWDNQVYIFGSSDVMYFENNKVTIPSNSPAVVSNYGAKYCVRYNSFYFFSLTYNLSPWFDAHGNQPSGVYSTMAVEIYGNKLICPNRSGILFDHRGGKALCFFNDLGTGPDFTAYAREERPDSIDPTQNPQPQHISNSYYWNSRRNGKLINFVVGTIKTGTATGGGSNYLDDKGFSTSWNTSQAALLGLYIIGGTGAGQWGTIINATATRVTIDRNWKTIPDGTSQYQITNDCCNAIHENIEFFNLDTAFNGSADLGCGPTLPDISKCNPGVGFWKTDQDCGTIDSNLVGANTTGKPDRPQIKGVLYKCTLNANGTKTWVEIFRPYPYPHPLRRVGPVSGSGSNN